MKTPKYTDTRYVNGYRPAAQTDVRKTFARIRAELKANADQEAALLKAQAERDAANAAEAQVKVKPLKEKAA